MKWTADPASSPHPSVPILVSTREAWKTWTGRAMDEDAFGDLEGVVGVAEVAGAPRAALPAEEQGAFHLGIGDDEVVLLHWFGSGKGLAARKKSLAARDEEEYLAGVLDVSDALVIGDAWTSGWALEAPKKPGKTTQGEDSLFAVPLPAGRYVVLEGTDDEEARWLRIRRGDPASYTPRPPDGPRAPSPAERAAALLHEILTPKLAGKNVVATSTLEKVKEIVTLDQAALLEKKVDELASTRPAYAQWLGILTRAAKGEDATADLKRLTEEWLAPATSTKSANQHLGKAELIEAFAIVSGLADLKTKVENAPPPDVFVEEGDFF